MSDEVVRSLQASVYKVREPYHGRVLKPDHEMHGKDLLGNATFKAIATDGYSYHYNLVEDLLGYARSSGFVVFGVVCFEPGVQTFACRNEHKLDKTFRCLFSRIDRYAKQCRPGGMVKLIFDDRDVKTNRDNAKAITNYLVKSPVGKGYNSILPYPLFAVSQGHNYGLQLADLVTTVTAKHYAKDERVARLWKIIRTMEHRFEDGGRRWSTIKVLGHKRQDQQKAFGGP